MFAVTSHNREDAHAHGAGTGTGIKAETIRPNIRAKHPGEPDLDPGIRLAPLCPRS